MSQYVNNVCKMAGQTRNEISDEYLRLICKNAQFLRFVSTRSIAEEFENSPDNGLKLSKLCFKFLYISNLFIVFLATAIECDMYGTPKWYLLLRGYSMFQSDYNRAPGASSKDLDEDFKVLKVGCFFN